jgi:hypothetical protein
MVFSEDLRSEAATTIFIRYLKAVGPAQIDAIIQRADEIDNTGEYPYRAMGLIIEELATKHADTTIPSRIFDRALSHFQRGSPFTNENNEFFELLQSAQDAVPKSVFKLGAMAFISHLTAHLNDKAPFRAQVYTPDGIVELDNPNMLLLLKIFPTLERVG